MATVPGVELGFLQKPEDPVVLTSPYFPTKVGGKPAWLDPVNLPSPQQLACQHCGKPCVLLLQLYAPLSDHPTVFHRSLFLFMCKESSCHHPASTKPFRVFRCNFAKDNPFYSAEDGSESDASTNGDNSSLESEVLAGINSISIAIKPDLKDTYKEMSDVSSSSAKLGGNVDSVLGQPPLCQVCGCMAPKHCGKCKMVNYCSRNHQLVDWKKGHKNLCEKMAAGLQCQWQVSAIYCIVLFLVEIPYLVQNTRSWKAYYRCIYFLLIILPTNNAYTWWELDENYLLLYYHCIKSIYSCSCLLTSLKLLKDCFQTVTNNK